MKILVHKKFPNILIYRDTSRNKRLRVVDCIDVDNTYFRIKLVTDISKASNFRSYVLPYKFLIEFRDGREFCIGNSNNLLSSDEKTILEELLSKGVLPGGYINSYFRFIPSPNYSPSSLEYQIITAGTLDENPPEAPYTEQLSKRKNSFINISDIEIGKTYFCPWFNNYLMCIGKANIPGLRNKYSYLYNYNINSQSNKVYSIEYSPYTPDIIKSYESGVDNSSLIFVRVGDKSGATLGLNKVTPEIIKDLGGIYFTLENPPKTSAINLIEVTNPRFTSCDIGRNPDVIIGIVRDEIMSWVKKGWMGAWQDLLLIKESRDCLGIPDKVAIDYVKKSFGNGIINSISGITGIKI